DLGQLGGFLASASENIYVLASEAEADAAMAALRGELGQCATDRDDVELTRTWEYDGIGDAAFQSEVFNDIGPRRIAISVGAAHTGSTLVVTITGVYIEEEFDGQSEMLAAAVSKVCGADCVGEITPRLTYSDATLPADFPLLLDEDVSPIGTYSGFVWSETLVNPDRYEYFCLPDLVYQGTVVHPSSQPVQVGGEAATIYQGEWYHEGEGGFYETVIQFLNAQEAADFVADYSELPDQCGEVVETHEQVVNQPASVDVSGADEALVWTIDEQVLPSDPGSAPAFHGVGMARSENVVVVIGFAAFGDPTTGTSGTWADYAIDTLAVAIDRAQR
ncbi:MAG TPA: hypothetical protein VFZ37_07515, partial [Jiangellaceae bacterium]